MPLKRRTHNIYAPGSIASLVWGIIGLLVAVYPVAASLLGVFGLFFMFFVIPLAGAIAGFIAIIFYNRTRKYLKRRNLARGKRLAKIGLISGIIALIFGCGIAGSFTYINLASKSPPNQPIGRANLYFYGDEDYYEIAVNTILLPDSTLLTVGARKLYDKSISPVHWDVVMLKTTLAGKQVWYRVIPEAGSVGAAINDDRSFLICFNSRRYQTDNVDHPATCILKMSLDGDSLDSGIFDLGGKVSSPSLTRLTDGNHIFLGNVRGRGDGTDVTVLMKVDQDCDSLWARFFPIKPERSFLDVVQSRDGGLLIGGYDYNREADAYTLTIMKTDSTGEELCQDPNQGKIDVGTVEIIEMEDKSLRLLGIYKLEDSRLDGCILKLDKDGTLVWNKSIGDGNYTHITGFIPWVDGNFLAVGWVPKRDNYFKLRAENVKSWDTYYLAVVSAEGELIHSFHGSKEYFEPWGITSIREGCAVITGFGGRGDKGDFGVLLNQDIGLLHYEADD